MEAVRRAERAFMDGIDWVGSVVAEEGIECGWHKGGALRDASARKDGSGAHIAALVAPLSSCLEVALALDRLLAHGEGLAEKLRADAAPADAEARRVLVAHLLAAYDMPSAVLQWSYLGEDERRATGSLSEPMVEFLNHLLRSNNEIVSVAAAGARRIGLQRLASVDDHSDDEEMVRVGSLDRLWEELQASKQYVEFMESEFFKQQQSAHARAAASGDRSHTSERDARAHHLQEVTTGFCARRLAALKLARTSGELALHPVTELGRIGELVLAAPDTLAREVPRRGTGALRKLGLAGLLLLTVQRRWALIVCHK
jgi:hypothetical protein